MKKNNIKQLKEMVNNNVLFTFLSFVFAFGGIVIASDEWSDAKEELNIA